MASNDRDVNTGDRLLGLRGFRIVSDGSTDEELRERCRSAQRTRGSAAPAIRLRTMPVERADWRGLIDGRLDPIDCPVIVLPMEKGAGGSGAFLGSDREERRWWIKPLNNGQAPRVVITEAVVGGAGRLIGAPVCETAIVRLPEEVAGWSFRPGCVTEAGLAHASREVPGADEVRQLIHRDKDDNARRHPGVAALYDWCWGADDQWLYALREEHRLYSHDHGAYLPEPGSDWSIETLENHVDEPHPLGGSNAGIDKGEVVRLVNALRAITRDALRTMLMRIPRSWPVEDEELAAVGWFLERRAPGVADRLLEWVGSAPEGATP